MIHHLVKHVADELNVYLDLRSPGQTERVVPGSLLGLDGNPDANLKEKIVISLVNVQEDPVYHSVDTFARRPDGTSELVRPEVRLNFYMLFIANLSIYGEALKAIANVVAFFQQRPATSFSDIPALADRRGRISFELHSMTFEQQNHLWGTLGAKYMPSVMYKLGLVQIDDSRIDALVPPVSEINAGATT